MKYWTIAQAPLRESAEPNSRKILDIPQGQVVDHIVDIGNMVGDRVLVSYDAAKAYRGWVYEALLEAYEEEFPANVVEIENDTPSPTDAAQYMIWKGQTQYNMCGELCVSYCHGAPLHILLTEWEAKKPTWYQRVFGSGGRARSTGLDELDSMLAVFGYETPSTRLSSALTDAVLRRPLVTPARMARLLKTHRIIVGVKIDAASGNLRGGGIGHWVTLESITPDGINRGWATLYNPFPNRMQRYSWDELVKSMSSPSGLLVKR